MYIILFDLLLYIYIYIIYTGTSRLGISLGSERYWEFPSNILTYYMLHYVTLCYYLHVISCDMKKVWLHDQYTVNTIYTVYKYDMFIDTLLKWIHDSIKGAVWGIKMVNMLFYNMYLI